MQTYTTQPITQTAQVCTRNWRELASTFWCKKLVRLSGTRFL